MLCSLYDLVLAECGTQQTAVTKITGLLRVGFGGAGADIISKVKKLSCSILMHAVISIVVVFIAAHTTVIVEFSFSPTASQYGPDRGCSD